MTRIYVVATCIAFALPAWANPPGDPDWIARGKSEMVAADSEFASKAGLEILEAGGNAIDAAVAVSFALAVTRPYSTGPGGGGFMIARMADGKVIVQDFREIAPAASTPDMFVKAKASNPNGPSPSEFGFLGVAVPGLVAGRCEALKQWGTMPLARVLQPAIKLARDGFPVDDDYVRETKGVLETYEKYPALKESCGYVYRTHLNDGKLFKIGDKLVQPGLARLFEGLAADGPDFYYKGRVATDIVNSMRRNGGIITEADLATYKPKLREPILSTYRDYQLILMPPPSSGGIALAEILNILETFKPTESYPHIYVEAIKHGFADRAAWLGDRDFVDVPVDRLTSKSYAQSLARKIDKDKAKEITTYGSFSAPKDSGTSHFCVVDRFGNAVVSTETINTEFGSLAAVDEWGLILNNEMDDFTAEPGKPNAFGLIQSSGNAVAPGKRPLSSMAPTIVLKDDKVFLLIGASGGPRIITSILKVLILELDLWMPLEMAVLDVRPHHQWQPDLVYFDNQSPTDALIQGHELMKRGHQVSEEHKTGIVQAIVWDLAVPGGWVGASDPRKGGKPAGR